MSSAYIRSAAQVLMYLAQGQVNMDLMSASGPSQGCEIMVAIRTSRVNWRYMSIGAEAHTTRQPIRSRRAGGYRRTIESRRGSDVAIFLI